MTTAILNQVQCQLKVCTVAIVWVGNRMRTRMIKKIVRQSDDLLTVSLRHCLRRDGQIVVLIHDYDAVESPEISLGIELPGYMTDVQSSPSSMLPHTAVGQIAYMPGTNACRIDQKAI